MHIREHSSSNFIVSDNSYISISVNNGEVQKEYKKNILLSSKSKNNFSKTIDFKGKDIKF